MSGQELKNQDEARQIKYEKEKRFFLLDGFLLFIDSLVLGVVIVVGDGPLEQVADYVIIFFEGVEVEYQISFLDL